MYCLVRSRRWCWLLACCLLIGCGPGQRGAVPEEEPSVPVSAYQVQARDLPETLLLPGRVIAADETAVSAAIPGRVDQVYAQVGERVTAGQLLATLETPGGQPNLQEARSALSALESQVAGLRNIPSVPSELGDEAGQLAQQIRTPILAALEAQVAQARQAVRLAEAQVRAARVTSPVNGVVLTRTAAPGQPAAPGMPLFSVGQTRSVVFELLIDPAQLNSLQSGQSALVQVENQPPVASRIAGISPALQPQTRTFTARVPLANPHGQFRPGMIGQATVTLDPHSGVLAVPHAALLTDEAGSYVLQIRGQRALQTRVETGYSNGTWTEIRKGLQTSDQVVLEGVERVQPGSRVEIVERKTTPVEVRR